MSDCASIDCLALPWAVARQRKWDAGRREYGGSAFTGDPLAEFAAEMVDAANYADEAARQGRISAGECYELHRIIDEAVVLIRNAHRRAASGPPVA